MFIVFWYRKIEVFYIILIIFLFIVLSILCLRKTKILGRGELISVIFKLFLGLKWNDVYVEKDIEMEC